MNKLILLAVGVIAVGSSSAALLVAKANQRSAPVATTQLAPPPPSPLATPTDQTQESEPVENHQASSNSVSISSQSTNSQSVTHTGSSSVSNVSVTVASDGSSRNDLSFSAGTVVALTIQVTGSGSLKFKSSGPVGGIDPISAGGTGTINFTADHSFTLQAQRPADDQLIGSPITIIVQ